MSVLQGSTTNSGGLGCLGMVAPTRMEGKPKVLDRILRLSKPSCQVLLCSYELANLGSYVSVYDPPAADGFLFVA